MDQRKMLRHLIGTVTLADSLRSTFGCSHSPLHLAVSPALVLECWAERSGADWMETRLDLRSTADNLLPHGGFNWLEWFIMQTAACRWATWMRVLRWNVFRLGPDTYNLVAEHCVSVLNVMPRYSADGRLIALANLLDHFFETSMVSIHSQFGLI